MRARAPRGAPARLGAPPRGAGVRALAVRALAALALAAFALVACRPLYVPLVPTGLPEPHPTRLSGGSTLAAGMGGRPRLELEVLDVARAGWLAVQWFGPGGAEAASDSAWLEPPAAAAVFDLPADVALRPGEWRAVVSFEGVILRQFLLVVPAQEGGAGAKRSPAAPPLKA